jgi:uncharacterized protein
LNDLWEANLTIPRNLWGLLLAVLVLAGGSHPSRTADLADLYRSRAIVTGTGEKNRRLGFRDCLDRVLLRVSGNPVLLKKPEMAPLREKAGNLVSEFRYRDRLEGVPIHDEQGSHDRPHDLTCIFDPAKIDAILAGFGSRPWLDERPKLTVFLSVEQGDRRFVLSADGSESPFMGESFANAAEPLAMRVVLPSQAVLAAAGLDARGLPGTDVANLDETARNSGGDQALTGNIAWSDHDLGWVADWRIASHGRLWRWQVRGVSFDEAFRVAMRGAVQILSGNGQP